MIVSWNWLKDYVPLDMPPQELSERLAMAGLNHEGTAEVGGDLAIDLEVTSNRPDCLGHLGVAREISVLWGTPLQRPTPQPAEAGPPVERLAKVQVECRDLCPRYTARVIQGVKVGPSPEWLTQRLQTVGIASVNNVVDITNYVLLECGQPLHAFDFDRLADSQIHVRAARPGESFAAIDHKTYTLDPTMCVIGDGRRAVALGGVMGGADTEVSSSTVNVLIEAADFHPMSIRGTARALKLFSDSSHRFERGVDPEGVEWASLRCCELILELAGGQLAQGSLDVGAPIPERGQVELRYAQIPRVLGVDVDRGEVLRILESLGFEPRDTGDALQSTVPSWRRRDCTREIDLIEEVARIHGYEKIPEDVRVPMSASRRTHAERVLDRVRDVLAASGFYEAITTSVVPAAWNAACNPWRADVPVVSHPPMLRGANELRTSLVPSLLQVRQRNDALSNQDAELFETASIYLGKAGGVEERRMASFVSRRDYLGLKGVVELMIRRLARGGAEGVFSAAGAPEFLTAGRRAAVLLNGQTLGYLGEVSAATLKKFKLRQDAAVVELDLDQLAAAAELTPQEAPLSPFPAMEQDLNFVVPEALRWDELAAAVVAGGGELLEEVRYRETYRDPERDGPQSKRLLLSIVLRSLEATLTSEQAEQARRQIEEQAAKLGGRLLT